MIKVGVIGITGRMGIATHVLLSSDSSVEFVGGISSHSDLSDIDNIFNESDVLIDFSTREASLIAASLARKFKKPLIIGTTGFSDLDLQVLRDASLDAAILHSDNFSISAQLLAIFSQKASGILTDFDATIIEGHRKQKRDTPSGTAKYIAKNLNKDPQILSIRAGTLAGEHTVRFIGEDEEFILSHRAFNRNVYARGAIKCAKWIVDKIPNFYSMVDYLNDQKIF